MAMQESGVTKISSGFRVKRTPGGSLRPVEGDRPLFCATPGGSVRQLDAALPAGILNPTEEQVEAFGLSDEEVEDLVEDQETRFVERWLVNHFNDQPVMEATTSNRETSAVSPIATSSSAATFDQELDAEDVAILSRVDRVFDETQSALPGVDVSFAWSNDFDSFNGKRETFSGGPVGPTANYLTPYDAFVAIWDKDFMQRIADETNRYAWQYITKRVEQDKLSSVSRIHEWRETDVDEMYVLFALFIAICYNPRLRVDDYWLTCEIFNSPGIRKIMSYNRYILLNKFLHFVDNQKFVPPSEKKLFKMKPIIDHCNAKFQELYVPSEHIAIDESLTLWKRHLSRAQCIRTKSARFGIKSFELCESVSGYLWRFIINTGKDSGKPSRVSINELAGKSTAIVLQLLEGLEFKGYYLTMDNFYNSPLLARYLKTLGFDCVGTLRVNRKHVPDAVKLKQSVPKGTLVARHSGDVAILSWKDARVVSMVSTFHSTETYLSTRAGQSLAKPIAVRDYNRYMGGIDLKDQKLSMYQLERKRGVKWYIKMTKRLLNVSVHNAYILNDASLAGQGKPLQSHRKFRENLVVGLLDRHRGATITIREVVPAAASEEIRLRKNIVHIPGNVSNNARTRCARCAKYDKSLVNHYKVRKVSTKCTTCNKALCFEGCWLDYHTMPDLSKLRE